MMLHPYLGVCLGELFCLGDEWSRFWRVFAPALIAPAASGIQAIIAMRPVLPSSVAI
jgi:hypothetical protein